ncbi:MAG: ABC transporter permease, partial [Anaerolineae bacterium]
MRKILAMAWNDIKIEFSDRSTIFFFLILPIAFTSIIGAGLSGLSEPSDNRIPVLVVDGDGGQLAARFVASLSASQAVRPVVVTATEAEVSLGEAATTLVTVPAGFSASLEAGAPTTVLLRRTGNDVNVLAVEQAVRAAANAVGDAVAVALASVAEAEEVRPFADAAARDAYFRQSLAAAEDMLREPPVVTTVTVAASASATTADGFAQTSPGQLVTWVMLTLV